MPDQHRPLSLIGFALLFVVAVAQTAFGQSADSTPTERTVEATKKSKPPIPDASGIWSGSIQDINGGDGEIDMTITQHNRAIKGVWKSSFDDPSVNESGTLTGTVVGTSSVRVILKPSVKRSCKLRALGLIVGSDEVAGNYTGLGCPRGFHDSGSFDIAR